MSNTIVIYKSKYGSTKKYAEWIQEELKCDIKSVDNVKGKDLEQYDNIVYGGGIHAGGITGFGFIKKNYKRIKDKNIVVFAVGLNVTEEKNMEDLRAINFNGKVKDLPCFLCKGAYDPFKITGFDKWLMGQVRKMIYKKPIIEREPQEKELMKSIDNGGDWTDKKYLEPILAAVKEQ